jgi:uncharacterized protein involved in oxidation of intracellular sulfur
LALRRRESLAVLHFLDIMACATCLKLRESSGSDFCPISTMRDIHEIARVSDRLLSF